MRNVVDAKELAHRLNDLDEHELRAFVNNFTKHAQLLGNTLDLYDLVLARHEPSKNHGEFAGRPNEENSIAYRIVIKQSGKKEIRVFVSSS